VIVSFSPLFKSLLGGRGQVSRESPRNNAPRRWYEHESTPALLAPGAGERKDALVEFPSQVVEHLSGGTLLYDFNKQVIGSC